MQAGATSRQGEEGGEHVSESEFGLASVVICSVRGIGGRSRWGRTGRGAVPGLSASPASHVITSHLRLICDESPRACCEDCCVHAVYSLHTRLTRKKCGDTRTSGAGDCRDARLRLRSLRAPGVGRGSSVRLGTPSLWPAPHRAAARARYAQPPPPPL